MRYLSNKEKKSLTEKLPKGYSIDKKDEITENENILLKNKEPFLIIKDKHTLLPHLKSIPENEYQAVYVDKGAIPFIIKGADLMRPGIQKIDTDISKGDIIMIKDENHNKTLALGISLFDSKELQQQEKGKSVEIFHFAGDNLY